MLDVEEMHIEFLVFESLDVAWILLMQIGSFNLVPRFCGALVGGFTAKRKNKETNREHKK